MIYGSWDMVCGTDPLKLEASSPKNSYPCPSPGHTTASFLTTLQQ